MKVYYVYKCIAIVWLLGTLISCEIAPSLRIGNPEPSFPSDLLPEETQSGEQRLGCLINGEVFTNVETYRLTADYNHYPPSPEEYRIHVTALNRSEIYLIIYPPFTLEDTLTNARILFWGEPYKGNASHGFKDKENVKVYLTYHDEENRILSGRFESTAQLFDKYYEPVDSFIYITDGRFDIEYR